MPTLQPGSHCADRQDAPSQPLATSSTIGGTRPAAPAQPLENFTLELETQAVIFVGRSHLTAGVGDSLVGNGYRIEVVAEFDEVWFDVEQQYQPLEVFGESVEHRAVDLSRIRVIGPHRLRIIVMGKSDVKYARVAYRFDTHALERNGIIVLVMSANRTVATK